MKTLCTHRANQWKNSEQCLIESSRVVGELRSNAIDLELPLKLGGSSVEEGDKNSDGCLSTNAALHGFD